MSFFTNLEFHRTGIGLVPAGPGQTQTAIYVERVPGSSSTLRSWLRVPRGEVGDPSDVSEGDELAEYLDHSPARVRFPT